MCQENEIQQLPAFVMPSRAGYGLTQAFKSHNRDVPYEATTVAAKAAKAYAIWTANYDTSFPTCEIFFPVVVMEGRLFECYLPRTTGPVVEEIDRGTLVTFPRLSSADNSIIDVVSDAGLDLFAQGALETAQQLCPEVRRRLNCSHWVPRPAYASGSPNSDRVRQSELSMGSISLSVMKHV